jgi:hypothetical protein
MIFPLNLAQLEVKIDSSLHLAVTSMLEWIGNFKRRYESERGKIAQSLFTSRALKFLFKLYEA